MRRDLELAISLRGRARRGAGHRPRCGETFRRYELRDPLRRLEEALGRGAAPRAAAGSARRRDACARSRSARLATLPADGEVAVAVRPPEVPEGALFADERRAGASPSRAAAEVLAGDCDGAGRGRRRARRAPGRRARREGARRRAGGPRASTRCSPATCSTRRGAATRSASCARTAGSTPGSRTARRGEAARSRARGGAAARDRGSAGCARCSRDVELPLVGVLRSMELAGIALDLERLAAITERVLAEVASLERSIWARGRRGVPDRLAAAARRDPVREARAVAQAARQDRLLDRRPRARGDPRRARDRPDDRALARALDAREDLPRAAARPRRRASRGCTRRSCRRSRRRAGCPRSTRTSRTSRSARALGREIRGCFVAGPGAGAARRRLLAGRAAGARAARRTSRCSRRSSARGEDVHTATACQVFGVEPDELDAGMRSKAKMINYGIVYGLTDFGLADRLQIPREEAAVFIATLLRALPGGARVHRAHDRAGDRSRAT